MNSEDFWGAESKKWWKVSGIYVIENELFSEKLNKRIFKIGMAFAGKGLGGRLGDYRKAYGLIPFKIHLIWHVGNPGNYSTNFVTKTERAIHNALNLQGKGAGPLAKEWFYDLDTIMNVILTLREDYIATMPAHINVSNWDIFTPQRIPRYKKGIHVSQEDKQMLAGVSTNSLTDVKVFTTKDKSKRLRKNPTQVDTFKPGK